MYNTKDIVNALNSGASPEEIAERFSETLNKAVKIQEEQKKKEEERAALKAQKREAAMDVMRVMANYFTQHGDKRTKEKFADWDQEEIEKNVDVFMQTLDSFGAIANTWKLPITFFM